MAFAATTVPVEAMDIAAAASPPPRACVADFDDFVGRDQSRQDMQDLQGLPSGPIIIPGGKVCLVALVDAVVSDMATK